jgi:hypothetical protein
MRPTILKVLITAGVPLLQVKYTMKAKAASAISHPIISKIKSTDFNFKRVEPG